MEDFVVNDKANEVFRDIFLIQSGMYTNEVFVGGVTSEVDTGVATLFFSFGTFSPSDIYLDFVLEPNVIDVAEQGLEVVGYALRVCAVRSAFYGMNVLCEV